MHGKIGEGPVRKKEKKDILSELGNRGVPGSKEESKRMEGKDLSK